MKEGYVYIALNLVNEPDKVKIGFTAKEPNQRAKDLKTEGMTGKFTAIYWIQTPYYKEFEKRVHAKLRRYRHAKTEFFRLSSKKAIDKLQQFWSEFEKELNVNQGIVVKDLKQKTQIIKWWESLDYHWRRTFVKNIPLNFEPTEQELLDGLINAVLHTNDKSLKRKIAKWIVDPNYKRKIKEYYKEDLNYAQRIEFISHIDKTPSFEELKQILSLENLNCFNNNQINILFPVKSLRKLKRIDASNTKIKSIEELSELKCLVKVAINQTQIISLAPLYKHKKNLTISCVGCPISRSEKERIVRETGNCIIKESFM